jgi:hypothetical protein
MLLDRNSKLDRGSTKFLELLFAALQVKKCSLYTLLVKAVLEPVPTHTVPV